MQNCRGRGLLSGFFQEFGLRTGQEKTGRTGLGQEMTGIQTGVVCLSTVGGVGWI
jgi:hypothetical protein